MEDVGPTQLARFYMPQGILLLQFRIHVYPKCSWIIYRDNTIFHMHNMSNLEGNVTYMGEDESFWS